MRWPQVKLGEVITLQRGYDLPERVRQPGTIPVVSSSGISGYHNEAKAQGPGIVTGRYGTLGQVYYVEEDFWPHNTTLFIKDFHGNDRRFAYYLLSSMTLTRHSGVSAVPGVNRNDIHQLLVALPPLPIQQRIAGILGALDDKIAVNRRINHRLEAMAQALYKHWFVDFGPFQDGEFVGSQGGLVPAGWIVKPLGQIVELLSGGTPKTSVHAYWDGDIPWVAAGDVRMGQPFIMLTERFITSLGVENSSAKRLPQFTTIITARGTVGECGLLSSQMTINQSNYGVQGRGSLGPFTTHLFVQNAVRHLQQQAYGTVFDTITRKTFDSVTVLLPPDDILIAFEGTLCDWYLEMLVNQKEQLKLAQTRDYLLPRLLSGAIPVEAAEEMAGR